MSQNQKKEKTTQNKKQDNKKVVQQKKQSDKPKLNNVKAQNANQTKNSPVKKQNETKLVTQALQNKIQKDLQIVKQQKLSEQSDDIQTKLVKPLHVKSNQQIKRQVKKWKSITDNLQKKRQIEYQLLKNKLQLEKAKQYQQKRQRFQVQKELKREKIRKTLQQIQQRKNKRTQLYQNSKTGAHRRGLSQNGKEPLFQQKQRQFQRKRQQLEAQIKQNILKKKKQMLFDINQLKKHQKNYIQDLKKRFKKSRKVKKSKSPVKQGQNSPQNQVNNQQQQQQYVQRQLHHSSQFNIFLKADPLQKQKDREKYIRRKKFEEKIRQIPITIDQQKMKQALIISDKAKNPLKYNYLSNVAALSDQKIYDQFKDFQININRKEIGNQYLRQMLGKISQQSRIRSKSQANLKAPTKKEYKNYLPQIQSLLKRKTIQQKPKPTNEVEQILYKYESKSDKVAQLNQKSNKYRRQALRKIAQIETSKQKNEYSEYLNKQQAIDQLYAKSVKMKLAGALIS